MKKIITLFILSLSSHMLIWGDSLVLLNDSNVRLSAVIQDATGEVLEEAVIDAQNTTTWSLDFEYFGDDAEQNNQASTP